jgi:hypothetical protein
MKASLFGSLHRFSVIELVSFIAQTRKTGVLSIDSGGGFQISFEAGRITGGSYDTPGIDSTISELAIRAMIQEGGTFAFLDSPPDQKRVVDLDPLPLIEQARKRIEESGAYDPEAILLLGRDLDSPERFSADQVRFLMETDGTATAGEIVKRCGFSEDKAGRIIGSLVRRGWLVSRGDSVTRAAATEGARGTAEAETSHAPAAPAGEISTPGGSLPTTAISFREIREQSEEKQPVARMACFTLDDTNSTTFPLFDDVLTIGRSAKNMIHLDDKSVSSSHARITLTEEGHLLEDLGSSNGTYVNGQRVEKAVLADKDRIRFGSVFMVYMIPTEVRSSGSAAGEEERA